MNNSICRKIRYRHLIRDTGHTLHCGLTSKILEMQDKCPKSSKIIYMQLRKQRSKS